MIISHAYRFIFLRTEKTGGTSLSHALAQVLDPSEMHPRPGPRPLPWRHLPGLHGLLKRQLPELFGLHGHATAAQVRRAVGAKVFDGYFKFAIERNPWDRQVSLYTHRQWKRGRPANFDADMRSPLYRATEYCRLRNWPIYAIGQEVVADRVLRYDRLGEELPALLASLGLPRIELPRMRAYDPGRPHYSTFYSDFTRDLVARWYAPEIAAFGFSFESAPGNGGALEDAA